MLGNKDFLMYLLISKFKFLLINKEFNMEISTDQPVVNSLLSRTITSLGSS